MKDDEEIIKFLVELGILKNIGYSEILGEDIYYIDSKAQELLPEITEMHKKNVNQVVFDLWELDMLDVAFDESGEPMVALNKNSVDPEKIEQLEDENLKKQLLMIVAIFDDRFGKDK